MSNCLIGPLKATSPTHSTCSHTSNDDPERGSSRRFWRSSDTTPTPTATNSSSSLHEATNNENPNTTSSRPLGSYHRVNRRPTLPFLGASPHRLHTQLPCRILT